MAHMIFHQIVGRMHISTSNRKVIRLAMDSLKDGYQTFRAWPKTQRRHFIESLLAVHAENRELYGFVMNRRPAKKRSKA